MDGANIEIREECGRGARKMEVSSSSWGYPNSWMVYFMENTTRMDDDWGYPDDLGKHQMLGGEESGDTGRNGDV